jgi:hypothetical protein
MNKAARFQILYTSSLETNNLRYVHIFLRTGSSAIFHASLFNCCEQECTLSKMLVRRISHSTESEVLYRKFNYNIGEYEDYSPLGYGTISLN